MEDKEMERMINAAGLIGASLWLRRWRWPDDAGGHYILVIVRVVV
jgi:hypothetical protein